MQISSFIVINECRFECATGERGKGRVKRQRREIETAIKKRENEKAP
jgi:hypothetical protein